MFVCFFVVVVFVFFVCLLFFFCSFSFVCFFLESVEDQVVSSWLIFGSPVGVHNQHPLSPLKH